jgi:lysophospholipase L1-like esterase
MTRRMAAWAALVLAVAAAGGAIVRHQWIESRIAALSAPPLPTYAQANAGLAAKSDRPRVILIGDSRIARWPLAQLPEKWETIGRGIGGEAAAQTARRFQADALDLRPDAVVIQSGINDLVAASFMEPVEALAILNRTIETIRQMAAGAAQRGSRVVVTTIIPPAEPELLRLPVWRDSIRDLVAQANAELKATRWPEGVTLADLGSELSRDGRTLSPDYRADTLHLNEAGYAKVNAAMTNHLGLVLSGPAPR